MRNFYPRILMSPEAEASGGGVDSSAVYSGTDANETFDNMEYESPASKQVGDKYKETFKERIEKAKELSKKKGEAGEDEKEEKKPKKEAKEEKRDDTLDFVDIKEDKDLNDDETEEKEEKKPKKEAKEEKELKEEKKEEPKDEDKELDKDQKGKLKVRMKGELYGLDQDSLVRYKVDGEYVERPLQEILNKASGVEALDKKFTEYGQKNKELEVREQALTKKSEVLKSVVDDVLKVVQDPNQNLWDALHLLVERSGGDVYSVKRRAMESVLGEVEKLQGMSDEGIKAYWLEEKDRIRTQAEENRKKAYEKEQTLIQSVQKVDALRQTLGVSEEQFNQTYDQLEAEGKLDKFTDEQIVEYASIKPHLDSVQDILEPFEDQIADQKYASIVQDFAKQIRSKELTVEQLKEIVKREFADEDLKDLAYREKAAKPKTSTGAPEKKATKHEYESFDDFE